jgi:hypothetical protein
VTAFSTAPFEAKVASPREAHGLRDSRGREDDLALDISLDRTATRV